MIDGLFHNWLSSCAVSVGKNHASNRTKGAEQA